MAKDNRVRTGLGTRFDYLSDGHLQAERKKHQATGVFLDYRTRMCAKCKTRKPKKGGKLLNGARAFVCADCVQSEAE